MALTGEPVAVEDAATDPRVAHRITDEEGIRSLLHVPIKVNGEVFGVFGVNYRQPRTLAGDEERVLLALAHRAAVAIENARVFAESQQRLHELEALYRADETLHGSLRLTDVLQSLADVATRCARRRQDLGARVGRRAARSWSWRPRAGTAPRASRSRWCPGATWCSTTRPTRRCSCCRTPRTISACPRRLRQIVEREGIEAAMAAPITVGGQMFGLFGAAFCTRARAHARRTAPGHGAGAARGAGDSERATVRAGAAGGDRRRTPAAGARAARRGHPDAVFGQSLIAEVVPRLWERNPVEGRRRLEELRRLTRGALAEMRTLLLELRPAALVETPFGQLVRQLGEATSSRANVLVDVDVDGEEWPVPAEVQIALYRIAQEALNNVGKHAGASRVQMHVRWAADAVERARAG